MALDLKINVSQILYQSDACKLTVQIIENNRVIILNCISDRFGHQVIDFSGKNYVAERQGSGYREMPSSKNRGFKVEIQSRRAFIKKLGAAFTIILALPATSIASRARQLDCEDRNERAFLRIFSDLGAPCAIGQRYLEIYPGEYDLNFLRTQILGGLASSNPAVAAANLREICQREFKDDNTVLLDGWIIARSEARACALISILQGSIDDF